MVFNKSYYILFTVLFNLVMWTEGKITPLSSQFRYSNHLPIYDFLTIGLNDMIMSVYYNFQ
jgi:hypothetical protein